MQTYAEDEAPQLPYGYPIMTMAAMVPTDLAAGDEPARAPLACEMYYPEITDWRPYNKALNPMPR